VVRRKIAPPAATRAQRSSDGRRILIGRYGPHAEQLTNGNMAAHDHDKIGLLGQVAAYASQSPERFGLAPSRIVSRRPVATQIAGKLAVLGVLLSFSVPAATQEGYHGHDHDRWHAEFYSKLMRPDTKTSCCNLADCRPTEIRSRDDHYEVKKDGRWIRVPTDKIVKVAAPDGGAHICAPPSESTSWDPDYVFCIIMPMET
jgi:hypothetical protein